MPDNEEVVELAPHDQSVSGLGSKTPSSLSRMLGTLASGAAVAGGIFAGNLLITNNVAESNSQNPISNDEAFADSPSRKAPAVGASATSSPSQAFSPSAGLVLSTGTTQKQGSVLPNQQATAGLTQINFGTTTSATQASGGYGSGSGNSTNSTQAGSGSGSGTGNTTNSTQAGSGSGEHESGDDSHEDSGHSDGESEDHGD